MAQAPIDVAETKRSGQDELDVNRYRLSFDEIREETLQTEKQVLNEQTKLNAFCDICSQLNFTKMSAEYLCYLCQKYMCGKCSESHDKSHRMIKLESEGGEREPRRRDFLGEMRKERKNERKSERKEMFDREEVSVVDTVNVKHELDKSDKYWITGLCGLDHTRWVLCDYYNDCIKVFSVGSHILQRYIRFGSAPWDVTEIKDKREPTEQVVMADMSVTNPAEPNKQCMVAVTLPGQRIILIINLTQNPAVITKSIKTEKRCYSIESSGDQLFVLCNDESGGHGPWFLCVVSTDGVAIKTINTPLARGLVPFLAVCHGRFYLTDWDNHKVLCMNDEGEVVYHKTIEGSGPVGVSVDPDNNNIYICAWGHRKVYRLDSRLESFETLVDLKSVYPEWPDAICVYRDRLYVSHGMYSTHVTVVRVL